MESSSSSSSRSRWWLLWSPRSRLFSSWWWWLWWCWCLLLLFLSSSWWWLLPVPVTTLPSADVESGDGRVGKLGGGSAPPKIRCAIIIMGLTVGGMMEVGVGGMIPVAAATAAAVPPNWLSWLSQYGDVCNIRWTAAKFPASANSSKPTAVWRFHFVLYHHAHTWSSRNKAHIMNTWVLNAHSHFLIHVYVFGTCFNV